MENLEKNIDIINYVSNHNSLRPKLVIGFAAETNDIKINAKNKLAEKNCDWVIANDVSNKSIGFDSDFNEVTIFYKDKKIKEERERVISLSQKYRKIAKLIHEKTIDQSNGVKGFRALIPSQLDEKIVRMYKEHIHSVQSEYDTYVKNTSLEKENDELGILTKSLNAMTNELNKRIATAENYSTDLLHEIRLSVHV